MKLFSTPTTLFFALFLSVALIGCGGESAETAEEQAPAMEEAASDAIVIEANDQLQFSVTEFTVAAGEEVTVTLQNVGSLPKETFGHNLVFLNAGVDLVEYATGAMANADNEYLPMDMSQTLAHTALLGPGEEDTITFMAPSEPGRYEFLCTFPGHYGTMRGVMIVE
ncbi:MAG: plastocyanin/azurin family copper-binding protein [Rhodothermales bacterium]